MPPMASQSAKRKWSDVFDNGEIFDKQSIMDLCASKLRYVNPAKPPRRRTEVPLLRNVLIVNTMKHLSSDLRVEKLMDYSSEDISVDPGHFEGLPPLSELLTDIMLDPQPMDQQHWVSASTPYSSLTPLEPSIPSYMETSESGMESGEDVKIVHDLLPCTSVVGMDPSHHVLWDTCDTLSHHSLHTWASDSSSEHITQSWSSSEHSSGLEGFLPNVSVNSNSTIQNKTSCSDSPFQASGGPLPSFTSLFETPQSTFTELLQSQSDATITHQMHIPPSLSLPHMQATSTEEFVGNVNLSEAELELLAMTFSSKLSPHVSIEDLVHALPQTTFKQNSQPSQAFFVPSSLQSSVFNSSSSNNQCASFCRNDQPQPSADDSGMVRVLVNL